MDNEYDDDFQAHSCAQEKNTQSKRGVNVLVTEVTQYSHEVWIEKGSILKDGSDPTSFMDDRLDL